MIHTEFWQLEEIQHLSTLGDTETYKARYLGKPCLVRISSQPQPSPSCVYGLQNERDLLRKLNRGYDFLPRLLKQDYWQDYLFSLYDCEVERGMEEWRALNPTGREILDFSADLIGIVEMLHKRNILLRNISPSGIFLSSAGKPLLLGLDRGSESYTPLPPGFVNGEPLSLLSSSPEMTGRTGHIVDGRSDIYSLGTLLYFLLSGKFPLQWDDTPGMIHRILTRLPDEITLPPSLETLRLPLRAVVEKTLEKDPERRYQNVSVLLYDWIGLQAGTGDFQAGKLDRKQGLTEPDRLYGRNGEMEILGKYYEESARGAFRSLAIRGEPGSGKTSLVYHFHESLKDREPLFLGVKFEEYKNSEYDSGLTRLLSALSDWTEKQSPQEMAEWKGALKGRRGIRSGIIRRLCPGSLGLLFDEEEGEGDPLPGGELSTRIIIGAVLELIRFLSVQRDALILFIDDLQWMDSGLASLLRELFDVPVPGVLLILSCRRGEGRGNREEPFQRVPLSLELENLDREAVARMVKEISPLSRDRQERLTGFFFSRTKGNPLFLNQYIGEINSRNLIFFNGKEGAWDLDYEGLINLPVFETELEMVTTQMGGLPGRVKQILVDISHLKSRFNLPELCELLPYPREEIALSLQFGEREGFLIGIESSPPAPPTREREFRFIHDKIKGVVHSFLDEEASRKLHSHISSRLFRHIRAESARDSLNLASHLVLSGQKNLSIPFSSAYGVLSRGVEFHLSTQNLESASDMLRYMIRFYGEEIGNSSPGDLYLLYFRTIECSYRLRQYDRAEEYLDALIGLSRSNGEKARAKELQMIYSFPRGEIGEALRAGQEGLRYLGFPVNTRPGMVSLASHFLALKIRLLRRGGKKILTLRENESERGRIGVRLFAGFIPSAYNSGNILLFGNSVLRAALLSLRYGLSPESSVGFIGYAILLAAFGNQREACRYGEISLAILRKYSDAQWEPMVKMLYLLFCLPWEEDWNRMDEWIDQVEKASRVTGEGLYRANAIMNRGLAAPEITLPELISLRAQGQPELESIGQYATIVVNETYRRAFAIMAGEIPPGEGPGLYDESLNRLKTTQQLSAAGLYVLNVARIALFFGQKEKYRECLKALRGASHSLRGAYYDEERSLFALILTVRLLNEPCSPLDRRGYLAGAGAIVRTFRKWSVQNPLFLQHYYLGMALLSGISARRKGRALPYFEKAIERADESHFLKYRALFRLLAADFCSAAGLVTIGGHLLSDSLYYYRQYGAFGVIEEIKGSTRLPVHGDGGSLSEERGALGRLDLQTVLNVSQSLAKEIDLDQLIREILSLIIQNCGASRGILILVDRGMPEVIMEDGGDRLVKTSAGEIGRYGKAFAALIRESLEGMKTVIENKAESMSRLCFPFVSQQKVKALVYLENRYSTGIFTEERVEILSLLSSAILISLENARLYRSIRDNNEELEERVRERTGELDRANAVLVEKLKKIEDLTEDLTQMAIKDDLTSLYNRRYLNEVFPGLLSSAHREKREIAVIMMDVDHFKRINDTYGHMAGDEVLRRIARIFREGSRLNDQIFRLGGEEFMILALRIDKDQARLFAEKVRRRIEEADLTDIGENLKVTISLGVYVSDSRTGDLEEVLRKSDIALYRAKERGRNRVESYPISD